MVNTIWGLMNRNMARKQAMHRRLSRAEKPIEKVAVGLRDVERIRQSPSHRNR
jgi:hypothetical protein